MQKREDRTSDRYENDRSNKFMEFISREMQGRSTKQRNVTNNIYVESNIVKQ
jgi:hypothetical protein